MMTSKKEGEFSHGSAAPRLTISRYDDKVCEWQVSRRLKTRYLAFHSSSSCSEMNAISSMPGVVSVLSRLIWS